MENFILLALKVAAVTYMYEGWLPTRGSKFSDFTGKLEVAYKRLLQP